MKIAISHNAWHVCGGGELYLGALAEELCKAHEVALLLTTPFPRQRLRNLLGLSFAGVKLITLRRPQPSAGQSSANRWPRLCAEMAVQNAARNFDAVIRVATGTVPPPCQAKSFLHVQVPLRDSSNPTPWQQARGLWNQAATNGYAKVFFNSQFTAQHSSLSSTSGKRGEVLYPPVDVGSTGPHLGWQKREATVLAVGRFDEAGHCKRQLELVEGFRKMAHEGLTGWKLVLAGTATARASSQRYLQQVQQAAVGLPVEIKLDLPRSALLALYENSRIFWHAAGFGSDAQEHPHMLEHFGISTVEAMARGCIPVVIDLGGQKEIVAHGVSGYRWTTIAELAACTWRVIKAGAQTDALATAARTAAAEFGRARFGQAARELVQS